MQTRNPTHLLVKLLMLVLVVLMSSSCTWMGLETESGTRMSYKSHRLDGNRLVIDTDIGLVRLSALTDEAIEVVYQTPINQFFPSFALADLEKTYPLEIIDKPLVITVKRNQLTIKISKRDLAIEFYRLGQLLSRQSSYFERKKIGEKEYHGFNFDLDNNEKILGGGERVLGMNRRGHRMPLYNRAHYGYQTESNQMNFSIPAIMSSKKYALLFDNTASGFLDIGKAEQNTLSFESVGGRMSYIFFASTSYPQIIENYVNVTGKQPLPPRWAFGNFASRFGYTSQKEVLDTVDLFEQLDIPLDSIIIDLYWFGPDIKGHVGNLSWDKETFPEPEKMLQQLKSKSIKTILVTEPFILSSSTKWQEANDKNILAKNGSGKAKRFDFYFGNTGLIDVFDQNAKDWFSDIYTGLDQQGVAGVWGDLGEPEVHPDDIIHYLSEFDIKVRGDEVHNAYGHEWGKMVYQNHLKIRPHTRPFMMMRSGFAGSQRYGMIPWTGDVDRSWKGLQPQVELSLQMSLFGMSYTHSDLGGFAGGEVFDKEMYIRWLQYGVFQPIYRPHAQAHIPPEPVFHDRQTQDILRKYIKLRYQLLPYNYNLAYQNSTTGMPLMRPVFFEDEANSSLIDIKDSYFWGDAFLVSPITESNKTQHIMNLPSGVWFDYWDDTRYRGDQKVALPVTIETLPVLVRAGSFIPMIKPINNSNNYSSENLILHYYADDTVPTSEGSMFEDDGINPVSLQDKAFEILKFSAKQNKNKGDLAIDLTRNGNGYDGVPQKRKLELVIHNWPNKPHALFINQRLLDKKDYKFDQSIRQLVVSVDWNEKNITITVQNKR